MTQVLEARRAFDEARAEATAMVARKRALLGLAMIRARESHAESQATMAAKMGVGTQQIRAYEQAYRDWLRDHPGETLEAS
jgi:DNA-binding XRE family transcriptional regulator